MRQFSHLPQCFPAKRFLTNLGSAKLGINRPLSLSLGLLSLLVPVMAIAPTPAAQAGTCASNCGPKPIRFTPGQYVQVDVVNKTANPILLQEVAGTDPIPVAPSRSFQLTRRGGTVDNSSVVFWDSLGFPVTVRISQPRVNQLRIEVTPGYEPPGHRSVYLRDDGSVAIL